MNYYEHHLGDYLRDTAHLSMLEDGAYRRLIDAYYIREVPLPAEMRDVFRLVRAQSKQDREAVETVLQEFFTLGTDGWRHGRCDREIERFQDKQRKAKASAAARWERRPQQSEGNANADANASTDAMRTHSEGNAPRARPQAPDTRPNTSEANASGAEAPPTTRDQVFGLGLPLLTAAGVSDKNARSMLGLMCKTHGDNAVVDALGRCATERPLEPVAWLQAALKSNRTRQAAAPSAEPAWRAEQRARNEAFAGPYAAKRPAQQTTLEMEAIDAAPPALG